ncbi:MAG: carbon starvation CstA family protein, partial [Mycetocola sp.]
MSTDAGRHAAGHEADETASVIEQDPNLPPVAVPDDEREAEERHWTPAKIALWVAIALLGGVAWVMLAVVRGETVNAIWFVFAAVCTYLIAYRFYSKFIERAIVRPDDRRATPAEYKANGKDYVPTDRRVVFGHHF